MNPQLDCMVEKFPGLGEQILILYDRSNEFKTLCYDYFLCLKSLEKWQMSLKKDKTFIDEYSDLKRTLESEVLDFIERTNKA